MSRVFAYCRVSTLEQTTDNQVLEIKSAGFAIEPHRVIAETVSGSTPASKRRGFAELEMKLEAGDILVVTKLDRLGRDVMDVKATLGRLHKNGVHVKCLAQGGLDLTSASGELTMTIIGAVAQFERDLLIERTQAGLARAKAEGKKLGRRFSLSTEKRRAVVAGAAEGRSLGELAKEFGTTRSTIQRVLRAEKPAQTLIAAR